MFFLRKYSSGKSKYPALLIDPAIEKWYHMKENTHAYFKFNRRTITYSVMLTLVVPGLIFLGCYKWHHALDFTGLGRGESPLVAEQRKRRLLERSEQ
ncbi:hypothetical protein HK099_002331 [Clydaea vesicula]|uniref:NADH-ubiquinone oxidoreductase B15 subunit n=1 Tax=Clydaea vesicula TaxID=447962 RepID=A0AAD5TTE5_9FUNG|nr:hypothetical protein HK099_002331 [Clydaea vesicula]KAJ3395061.1 hypothetical protein HDU92_006261 [Lobulomyces angularis]